MSLPFAGIFGLGGPVVIVIGVLGFVFCGVLAVAVLLPLAKAGRQFSRYCPKCGRGLNQPADARFCCYCGDVLA